ncbi:MAG: CGNR zinc finger domain-containing protein [Chloroflexia bacterium]|nr:CGNR zinc finger domain-containing protein [Chloroflexia bacterium]
MGHSIACNQQTRGRGADPAFPRLLGERLCLNFVNTIESPRGSHPAEFLRSYADLVRWGRHVGLLSDTEAERLLREGAQRPNAASATFEQALTLRAALTRIFRAVADGNVPEETDLRQVQATYYAALARARLAPGAERYQWAWGADDEALDRPLWDVARSAVALLTEDDLARVKVCPGANDCGWLFYDTSKNGSRRWCSMEGCGSRVKMRQHYARHRAH